MANLSLANVVNISVQAAQTGIGEFNVNNLALFTNDTPGSSFGTAGYAIYLDPTTVGEDFGTDSETFAMANAAFSQQPNMLAGGGYLTIIPYIPGQQTLTFSTVPTAGSFFLAFQGGGSIAVTFNESAGSIESAIHGSPMLLTQVDVDGAISGSAGLLFNFYGVYNMGTGFAVSGNTLTSSGGSTAVTITSTISASSETLAAAITRTTGLVEYFGIMDTNTAPTHGSTDLLAASAVVEAMNKVVFFVSEDPDDVEADTGIFDLVRQANAHKTRCLFYGYGSSSTNALGMMASYAGRALSTAFDGNNTTQTMHLKDLTGVVADQSMTQTLLIKCINAGTDSYPSLQGIPKVFTSGENHYFDQVFNLGWFVGALQVAGFNYLAQAATKIPQTEAGMTGLKGAYRQVCQQGVTNAYMAPGSWTSSTTFGNQIDFLANIGNVGYYIYSQPIALQNPVDRAARQAPLVQIAVKEAGAVQETNVIIFINA